MRSLRWAGLVLAVGMVVGCQPKPQPAPPPPPEPPPANPEIMASVRQQLRQDDPNAQVGQIAGVMPDRHLVAVTDLPVQDFHTGDALVLTNTALQKIATGVVDNISGRYVVVRYDNATRDPREGDLAVRVSPHGPFRGQSQQMQPTDTGTPNNPPPANTNPPTGNTNPPANAPTETPANSPATQPAGTGGGAGATAAPGDNTAQPTGQSTNPQPAQTQTPTQPAAGSTTAPRPGDFNK